MATCAQDYKFYDDEAARRYEALSRGGMKSVFMKILPKMAKQKGNELKAFSKIKLDMEKIKEINTQKAKIED